ncbi:O-antigen ligase family protein [Candidatus Poribacteria bacterium]|nr:O-antigen ligase family protein [Candidatus Poribacteria bacterium]
MPNPKSDPSLYAASEVIFNTATYIGFLIFLLALPFGYSTAFLNIGLSFVLLGWVGRMISERKLGWQRTPLDLLIALFLGLALIACLFAPHPARSSFGYFWKLLRAILLFYAVIHSRLGNRWQHIVIAFIAAAGISSALGLWYYANDTRLAIDFMGRIGVQFQEELGVGKTQNGQISDELRAELRECSVPLSETATIAPLKRFPDEWRIDDPARQRRYVVRKDETHLRVYMVEQRLTGTFKMPNDLGAYLALGLPFVMGYFVAGWRQKQNRIRITLVLGAVIILMSANLVLTLTRAAWISVTFATACLGVYLIVRAWVTGRGWVTQPLRRLESSGGLGRRILLGSAVIIVMLSVSLFLMPQHIKTRFQTMIEQPTGFMGERPQWWRTSLELIKEYPLTGIGLGRFRYEYQRSGPPEQYNIPYHAHNIYLHIAVEHGIPSLLLFLWIVVILCRQVYSIRGATGFWGSGTFIGASGFLISALIYGLADNILHQRTVLLFWFIVGNLIFYIKDQKHEETLEAG